MNKKSYASRSWLMACTLAVFAGCGGGTEEPVVTTETDAGSDTQACGTGQLACGSSCVDPQLDPTNCGSCGNACGAGEVCSKGKCGSTCSESQTLCKPDGGAAYCATTQSDNANC